MSEAQNTVAETPVAAPAVTDVPAAEPTATETAATTEAPAAAETTEAAAEAPKEEAAKEEITPATDGILGYKGPGLVKSLRFAKRYFYLTEDATEPKNLTAFIASEKAAGHSTAAWASQTGKGLLFFTKRAEDKATPAGIFNLSEISDLSKEGTNEFLFKLNGHKHVFQAANAAERDSWIAAIEAQTAVATAEKETVTSSEGYKAELEKLSKPATAAIAAATVTKKEKEEKKEEAAPAAAATEDKADAKSRSRSRAKRASIFGSILGKKDAEEKKEETPAEATTETPAAGEAAAPAAAEPTTEGAATETPEAAATTEATEDKKEEETKKDATKSKRASIFGTLFQKVTSPSHEKSEKEATAAQDTPVASSAPQLENPVEEAATEPIEPETVTAAADAADEAPKDATETATTPTSKRGGFFSKKEKKAEKEEDAAAETKEKRRTSLFGTLGGKKEKKDTSDAEATEGESKPKNKLGGLFRKPSKAVKAEEKKDEEAPAEGEAAAAAEEADKPEPISKDEATTAAPAVNGETEAPAVSNTAPVVEATA